MDAAEVTHQLCRSFSDISTFTECFCICQSVIRLVWRAKSGEFIGMGVPVECIIHDQRHAMAVGDTGKLLNIQHFEGGIGDCFAEQCLRIRTESCGNFFFAGIRIDESYVNAKFLHCHSEQVESATVDSGRANEMVTCLADIEDSVEVGSLTAGSQHGGHTTFKGGNLGCNGVIRRVLQAGIEVTAVFQIEKTCHLLAGVVFESCTLINGQHAWFALFRRPACLYTQGFGLELFCHNDIGFYVFIAKKSFNGAKVGKIIVFLLRLRVK